jgi:signal transduction histidine kinase
LRTDLARVLGGIRGDRVQLQQVVMNLILNAMDSIDHAAGPKREVHVSTRAVADGVQVSVVDTGTGLSSEVLNRMFEPFFTTKSQGLGMGLSINKALIAAHGGRLWAKNNPNGGATVGFVLPTFTPTSSPATI